MKKFILLCLLAVIAIIASGCGVEPGPICGDDVCNVESETALNCNDCRTCTETDNGLDFELQGTTTGYVPGNQYELTGTDTCIEDINGGTYAVGSSNRLQESFCNDQRYMDGLNKECNCVNGACVSITCTDTDGGWNYNVKGTVTNFINGATYTDSCNSDGTLHEWSCNSGAVGNTVTTCSLHNAGDVCADGACTGIDSIH